MNTGFDFIKKLRPLGCVLVIVCFVGFLGMCFFSGGEEPIPGYSALHDKAYYAQNLPELKSELEQNVLPHLSGIVSCSMGEDKIIITIEKTEFFKVRNALLNYFDESLLDLRQNN